MLVTCNHYWHVEIYSAFRAYVRKPIAAFGMSYEPEVKAVRYFVVDSSYLSIEAILSGLEIRKMESDKWMDCAAYGVCIILSRNRWNWVTLPLVVSIRRDL